LIHSHDATYFRNAVFVQQFDAEMTHAPIPKLRHQGRQVLGLGMEQRVAALAVGQQPVLYAPTVAQSNVVPQA
jgi:hypothetical protein